MKLSSSVFTTLPSTDYELLDSGYGENGGEKLERFGSILLSRPDPHALWPKTLPESWGKADAVFHSSAALGTKTGKWKTKGKIPEDWRVILEGNTFSLKISLFKHIGLFPEQSVHWKWLQDNISERQKEGQKSISVLNLFGYTGGASLACARAGAQVTHVDASESALLWARENRDLSGLATDSIRFIEEDVRKFVEREIRRGKTYDVIVMDPPVYGRGNKNEVWNIETDLMPLLLRLRNLISETPLGFILNGYASGYSHVSYAQMLEATTDGLACTVQSGELVIRQSSGDIFLPAGITARCDFNSEV